MTGIAIDEATLRDLVAKHPFYVIAQIYGCGTRAIAAMAQTYGLTSAFVAKGPTDEEDRLIRDYVEAGWSLKRIGEEIGRSHDFLARRVRRLHGIEHIGSLGRPERSGGWPVPDTTAALAFRGKCFEDVAEHVLNRECSPRRLPINGAALAAAGRVSAMSFTRSAADLCADA